MATKKTAKPKPKAKPVRSPEQIDGLARAHPRANDLIAPGQAPAMTASQDQAGAIMEALSRRFTPDSLCNTLQAMLTAVEESKNRLGEVIERPAWHIRLKATETILAYMVGRPIERQMLLRAEAPATMDDLISEAERSPAFAASLLALLQKIVDRGERSGSDTTANAQT